jgi:hypothetical protein
MRTVNFTPRKNVVRYHTRMSPSTIIVDGTEILHEKTHKLNKELLIVVRDSENSEVVLNSTEYTHVIVKSLIKTVIKPDVGLIDEEWEELLLEKSSCVQFQFVEDSWLILSSDGIKFD